MTTVSNELEFIIKRNKMLKDLEKKAEQLGFIKVESDFFEELIPFTKMNQTINIQKLVKVQNLKGEVLLLKPDITTNVIKQVIPKISNGNFADLYYSDTVFRYKTNGDIETIRQFGVEVIGRDSLDSDIKLVKFIADILSSYNLTYFIEIGNQKFVSIIFEDMNLSASDIKIMKRMLKAKNTHELEDFLLRLDKLKYKDLLTNIISNQNDIVLYKSIILKDNLNTLLLNELNDLETICKNLSGVNSIIDLTIINEFDYYNGPIYKAYIDNYNQEILSGGRYDYLTKDFGKEIPALGFTMNLGVLLREVLS